jgi:hypothetical protein
VRKSSGQNVTYYDSGLYLRILLPVLGGLLRSGNSTSALAITTPRSLKDGTALNKMKGSSTRDEHYAPRVAGAIAIKESSRGGNPCISSYTTYDRLYRGYLLDKS